MTSVRAAMPKAGLFLGLTDSPHGLFIHSTNIHPVSTVCQEHFQVPGMQQRRKQTFFFFFFGLIELTL